MGVGYRDGDVWNPDTKQWEPKIKDTNPPVSVSDMTRSINMRFVMPPTVMTAWRELVDLEMAYMDKPGVVHSYTNKGDTLLLKDTRGRWHLEFSIGESVLEVRWRGDSKPVSSYVGPFKFWFKPGTDPTGTDDKEDCSVALITRTPVYEEVGAYEMGFTFVGKVTLNLCKTYVELPDPKKDEAKDEAKVAEELGAMGCGTL